MLCNKINALQGGVSDEWRELSGMICRQGPSTRAINKSYAKGYQ
jgi:hypothetical protein